MLGRLLKGNVIVQGLSGNMAISQFFSLKFLCICIHIRVFYGGVPTDIRKILVCG